MAEAITGGKAGGSTQAVREGERNETDGGGRELRQDCQYRICGCDMARGFTTCCESGTVPIPPFLALFVLPQ